MTPARRTSSCCPVNSSPRRTRSIRKRVGRSLSIQRSFGHDSRYRVGGTARPPPLLPQQWRWGWGGGHKEHSHFCQIKSWTTAALPLTEQHICLPTNQPSRTEAIDTADYAAALGEFRTDRLHTAQSGEERVAGNRQPAMVFRGVEPVRLSFPTSTVN